MNLVANTATTAAIVQIIALDLPDDQRNPVYPMR
jgi:hypothetical protein